MWHRSTRCPWTGAGSIRALGIGVAEHGRDSSFDFRGADHTRTGDAAGRRGRPGAGRGVHGAGSCFLCFCSDSVVVKAVGSDHDRGGGRTRGAGGSPCTRSRPSGFGSGPPAVVAGAGGRPRCRGRRVQCPHRPSDIDDRCTRRRNDTGRALTPSVGRTPSVLRRTSEGPVMLPVRTASRSATSSATPSARKTLQNPFYFRAAVGRSPCRNGGNEAK